eukprot:jgi/Ulvmu1/12116/UM084_0042.1
MQVNPHQNSKHPVAGNLSIGLSKTCSRPSASAQSHDQQALQWYQHSFQLCQQPDPARRQPGRGGSPPGVLEGQLQPSTRRRPSGRFLPASAALLPTSCLQLTQYTN